MNKIDSFIIYTKHKKLINKMPNEDAGALLKAIFAYVETGELPDLPYGADMAFEVIKDVIDFNFEKREAMREKASEYGKMGAQKRWGDHPISENSHPISENSHPISENSHPISENGHPISENSHPISENGHPISGDRVGMGYDSLTVSVSVSESVSESVSVSKKLSDEVRFSPAYASEDFGKSPTAHARDSTEDEDIDKVVNAWNRKADKWRLVKVEKFNKKSSRGKKLIARLKEKDVGLTGLLDAIERIEKSRFLRGESTSWRITFDWIIKPSNIHKVLYGNYDDSEITNHDDKMFYRPKNSLMTEREKVQNRENNKGSLDDLELLQMLKERREKENKKKTEEVLTEIIPEGGLFSGMD